MSISLPAFVHRTPTGTLKPARILWVTPMPPHAQGHGAIPVVQHSALMALCGHHKVTLVTVVGPEQEQFDALDHLRTAGVEVHAVQRTEPLGLARWRRRWRLASTWLKGQDPFRTIWFWEPGVQQTIDRLLVETRFDLIQVEDSAAGIYYHGGTVPSLFTEYEVRRPRAVDWRGLLMQKNARFALSEADWVRWRAYQARVWQRFDRVQVFTERDAYSIRMLAPNIAPRVRVNPFGVTLPSDISEECEEPGVLVFVGDFTHPPNVDAAAWLVGEIMPLLRSSCAQAKLFIVGKAPPPALCALAGHDIVITGQVPEVEPFLQKASVVLAPVRIGGGQRLKVLMGMAYGKAVVTTRRGAEGLAVAGHSLPLVIADQTQEIADTTARLLTDPAARRALGARARAFAARHYSPTAYVRRLETIYTELIEDDECSTYQRCHSDLPARR